MPGDERLAGDEHEAVDESPQRSGGVCIRGPDRGLHRDIRSAAVDNGVAGAAKDGHTRHPTCRRRPGAAHNGLVKTVALIDIGAEAVLLAGGGRAILLQLANPAVGYAVADHSNFAADPLRRLRNTLTYVYALVFGTPHQVATVRSMVQRAHGPVRSETYDASDAGLQLWVAATLYDTAATLHARVFGPLDEASADRVYQDYAVVGTALGMPAALWPIDREAFGHYWQAQLAGLEVDDRVRAVAAQLLHPASGPLWMRALMPIARLATGGLLPPALRAAYALPWTDRRQHRFDRMMDVTARLYPHLPVRLRHWPKNHLLRRLG
jgi:uncharacterized protein (DUF2236 family)